MLWRALARIHCGGPCQGIPHWHCSREGEEVMEDSPPEGQNVNSDSSEESDSEVSTPRHHHSDSVSWAEEGEHGEELTEESAGEFVGEPAEEFTKEPTEELAEEPAEELAEGPDEELTEEPTEELAGEPTVGPAESPAEETTVECLTSE